MGHTDPPHSLLDRLRTLTDPHHRRRRLGRRHPLSLHIRRAVAALLFGVAAVLAALPSSEPTSPMVVTNRDLPVGSSLRADDVRTVAAPAALIPAGALTGTDTAIGRVLTSAARAGEPLTDARLVGTDGALGAGTDAAVPIRLADAGVAELLHPGAKVDVVTLDSAAGSRRVLASNATVVTITSPPEDTPGSAHRGRIVLIAVSAETATRVAAASLNQPVTVTLR